MTKLFNNGKKLLSITLALAIIALSVFTGIDFSVKADSTIKCSDRRTIYWNGTATAPTSTAAGTKDDPVIINTAEEFAYLASVNNTAYTLQADGVTPKYFKIADDIGAIVLQPEAYAADIMALKSAAEVKTYFETNASSLKKWYELGGNKSFFCGYLEGNGVTIYGAYQNSAKHAGLFITLDAGASIHNLAVKNSYMVSTATANTFAGAIFAATSNKSYGLKTQGMVWLDGCVVANCYIRNANTKNNYSGVLAGYANADSITVDNCMVYGNDAKYGDNVNMPLVGGMANSTAIGSTKPVELEPITNSTCYANGFRNIVCMGTDVTNTAINLSSRINEDYCFANVITDGVSGTVNFADKPRTYTEAQIKGITVADFATLELNDAWIKTGTYPELKTFHDATFTTSPSSQDAYAGHASACSCGVGAGAITAHTYAVTGEGDDATAKCSVCNFVCDHENENYYIYTQDGGVTKKVCDCGVTTTVSGDIDVEITSVKCSDKKTIYWDGTVTEPTSTAAGTKDDPVIINTASELAYIAQDNASYTLQADGSPKYFKVADDIGTIVLQPENYASSILALNSALETKTYFENGTKYKTWPLISYNGSSFCGNFDGNGVEIYGLYQIASAYAGLFAIVDAGASIHNVAVKNSYITSKGTGYFVGGIFGYSRNGGQGNGMIWLDGCVVANCYMRNSNTAAIGSGVLFGRLHNDGVTADNCMVYGNDAEYGAAPGTEYGAGTKMAMVGGGFYTKIDSNTAKKPVELEVKIRESDGYCYNMFRNIICMDADVMNTKDSLAYLVNRPDCFENVLTNGAAGELTFANDLTDTYTTSQVKSITVADFATVTLGDAWIKTGTYPELKTFHDATFTATVSSKDAYAGHVLACSCGVGEDDVVNHDYTVTGEGNDATAKCSECNFVCDHANKNYYTYTTSGTIGTKVCACGVTTTETVELKCSDKKTIYWDGTATAPTSTAAGTAADPIIINTASELAYIAQDKASYTMHADGSQKYFKIADDIGTIVLQKESFAKDILALKSAAEVKAYFEKNESSVLEWKVIGYNKACFVGCLDGNGVEIYGLYQTSTAYAGLFAIVDAGAAIRNLALKNAYITTSSTSYHTGAIFGFSQSISYDLKTSGMIWIDSCVVANCYLRSPNTASDRSGVLAGLVNGDAITVDNCIVYGNDAEYGDGVKMTLVGGGYGSTVSADSRKPAELNAKVLEKDNYFYNAFRNVICMDADVMNTKTAFGYRKNEADCFENVLTNGIAGTVQFTDKSETYAESQIKKITVADFATLTLGDAWIKTGTYPELKVFHDNEFSVTVYAADNYAGHSISCSCGVGAGAVSKHNYTKIGEGNDAISKCNDCGFACDHNGTGHYDYHETPGDCVTNGTFIKNCECGVTIRGISSVASGVHTPSDRFQAGADKHTNICVNCETAFDTVAHVDENNDNICDICGWICGAFEGASITITDSIAVNYLIDKNVVDSLGYTDFYFTFNIFGKDFTVSEYTLDGEYYVFTLDKLAPQYMTETISVKLYAKNGDADYSSTISEYSIEQYCLNMLEKNADDKELCTLLVDTLNYGAQSQKYVGYNTGKLANAKLTDAQKVLGTLGDVITISDKNLKYEVIDNPTVSWKGAGLYLDEQATLRFTIESENINGLVVKAVCGLKEIIVPASEFVKRTGNNYYVYVRGINVSQMSDVVILTVYKDDVAVSNTISYSIESYADSKIGGSDESLSNLMVAMMKYGNSAKAYAYSNCDHDFDETVIEEAALFAAGVKEYDCKNCAYSCVKTAPVEKIKILSIGNSFSLNSMNQLYAMCESAGVKDIDIAIMYIAGCSLTQHWENVQSNATTYELHRNNNGEWTKTVNYSIEQILTEKDWDIISLQNSPGGAARANDYSNLDNMTDYVKAQCPNAELVWFMTWSFSDDSTYLSGFQNDSRYMYHCIVDCVNTYVDANSNYHSVVPVGTAVMNARTSDTIGDMVHPTLDSHLTEDLGYYVAAYTWFGHITGMSPYDIDFVPGHAKAQENVATILECAQNALDTPYEIARPSKFTYSFAVVGDTQYLVKHDVNKGTNNNGTLYDWILENKDSKNIQNVLGMGDIIDAYSDEAQWAQAMAGINKLNGKIPYYLVRGNHDNSDAYNANLNTDIYKSQFSDPDIEDQSKCFYSQSFVNSAYTKFTVGDTKYLLMMLDYGAKDDMIAWANNVIAANPTYKVIITTHGYLSASGSWLDNESYSPDPDGTSIFNSGIEMWEKLVSKHSNIFMVLCGHDNKVPKGDILMLQSKGDAGNTVSQLLINPQTVEWDENAQQLGMVAMLYFTEDGSEVMVDFVSTVLSKEKGYEYHYRSFANDFVFNP